MKFYSSFSFYLDYFYIVCRLFHNTYWTRLLCELNAFIYEKTTSKSDARWKLKRNRIVLHCMEKMRKMCKCTESACSHRQSTWQTWQQHIFIFTVALSQVKYCVRFTNRFEQKGRKTLSGGKNTFWTVTTKTKVVDCMCIEKEKERARERKSWCITETQTKMRRWIPITMTAAATVYVHLFERLKTISLTSRHFPQVIKIFQKLWNKIRISIGKCLGEKNTSKLH